MPFLFQKTNGALRFTPMFPGRMSLTRLEAKSRELVQTFVKVEGVLAGIIQFQKKCFTKFKSGKFQSGTPLQDHRGESWEYKGMYPTPKSYPCKPIAGLAKMAKNTRKKKKKQGEGEITLQLSQGTHQCCSPHGHISWRSFEKCYLLLGQIWGEATTSMFFFFLAKWCLVFSSWYPH